MENVEPRKKPNPKRFEKTLFVNHREEIALEKRLASISLTSRLRMMELDRERIDLRNEYRLSKRRKMPSDDHPTRPKLAAFQGEKVPRPQRASLDPVNAYLLSEYRRVGQVIPAILTSLSAKDSKSEIDFPRPRVEEEEEGREGGGGGGGGGLREPDLKRMINLIRKVKKLRHDMALNTRLDSHIKLSFRDLMKNIEEKEKRSSWSDTYTDGACMLLRRKMNKARKTSLPTAGSLQASRSRHNEGQSSCDGYGDDRPCTTLPSKSRSRSLQLPVLPLTRSVTTLAAIGRQPTYMTSHMKQQLAEEDECITRTKVTRELENFDRIIGKIGHFMDKCRIDKFRCGPSVGISD